MRAITDPSSAVEGYWWRDTTNQNVTAQHSEDQFNSEAYQIYVSSKLRVYVYSSPSGANTTAIVSTNGFYIVGPGGDKTEAMVDKNALQRIYPPISYKNLLGVIYTGASPQETWGSEFWRFSFYSKPLAPVYAGPGYTEARRNGAKWKPQSPPARTKPMGVSGELMQMVIRPSVIWRGGRMDSSASGQ